MFRAVNAVKKLENLSNAIKTNISDKYEKIQMPERFKNTIIEKWALYWKNLLIDYKEVAIDVGKDIKTKPIRSSIIGLTSMATYLCCKNNPDELSFVNEVTHFRNEVSLVSDTARNTISSQHLRFLEQCYNEGIVRRLSIGIVSFMWLDNYDKALAIYKAICPYLQYEYLTFHGRIIDVGFWNKWWTLHNKMIDYDINY